MKKVIAAISFFFYFVVTTGVVINLHYCMDRLASVHLFAKNDDKCGQCGMDVHQSNGCCHDEVKVIKLQQDQNKVSVATYNLLVPAQTDIRPSIYLATTENNFDISTTRYRHSPPLLSASDTYLEINVFRI